MGFPDISRIGNRMVLGTVQLGLRYGIANTAGQPDEESAFAILRAAHASGARILDTAQGYGASEEIIGRFLRLDPQFRFDVISKLRPDLKIEDGRAVAAAIEASAELLGRPLAGMMLHNAGHLAGWNGALGAAFRQCIAAGQIDAAGVSIYTPEQFEQALEIDDIRLIQLPFNALDRKFLESGAFERARRREKTIFIRSVYLQGLLLMELEALPQNLLAARPALADWRAICARHAVSPAVAALKYVQSAVPDGLLVLGCETVAQWTENAAIWKMPALDSRCIGDIGAMPPVAEEIINPSLWRR
jgi:aryl-alcohol dehydrogenase-like predicted oxidoreductase